MEPKEQDLLARQARLANASEAVGSVATQGGAFETGATEGRTAAASNATNPPYATFRPSVEGDQTSFDLPRQVPQAFEGATVVWLDDGQAVIVEQTGGISPAY